MKYAVVKFSGTQYKVGEEDKIEVKGFLGKKGEDVVLEEVLLLAEDGKVQIGKPVLKDVKVIAEVIDQKLGDKVIVAKFKAKTGYRRRNGFRAQQTVLLIKKISS